jgi:nicotinate-nucleotide adenylyltransferase
MRPIGVFGGTFDPVHFGHLRPALELMEALSLEQVHLIPCAIPPHRDIPRAEETHRLEMLRRAVAGQPGFVVDERELRRGGVSYMVDTLASLRDEFGERPLCLLLGMDAFLQLHRWHRWTEIPELAHVVATHRPGWELDSVSVAGPMAELLAQRRVARAETLSSEPAGRILLQSVTQLDISATAIRRAVCEGRSARYLTRDAVLEYIAEHDLYQQAT